MAAGLAITGQALSSPMPQAFGMLTADLVSMSRAADRATPSPYPNRWRVRNMTLAAIPLGLFKLAFSVGVLSWGWFQAELDPDRMQTLTFAMPMHTWLADIYVMRARGRFWCSRPVPVMLLASLAKFAIVTGFALGGIPMVPLPLGIVIALSVATVGFAVVMDELKVRVFHRLRID
jgi:H+-transporting ATPase